MKKVRLNNQDELDSTYSIGTVSGVKGLILESWGPKDRNPEYAKALEVILSRLKDGGVPYINVYIVSKNLTRALPNLYDRAIIIDGSKEINLSNKEPRDLRLAIGREVENLKENPTKFTKGGNRYKRILIHSPLISNQDWEAIASNSSQLNIIASTADEEKLDNIVRELLKNKLTKPVGSDQPKQSNIATIVYSRDPLVKAWVLQNANGTCEACSSPAPFEKSDGAPYLEVHHIHLLSEGGSDTVNNTIAVCPNCHRNLHFGKNKQDTTKKIVNKIDRLEQKDSS